MEWKKAVGILTFLILVSEGLIELARVFARKEFDKEIKDADFTVLEDEEEIND